MREPLLPPYGIPDGPASSDEEALRAFLDGGNVGHSPRFHLEDEALLVDRLTHLALRVAHRVFLLRNDLPADAEDARALTAASMRSEGLLEIDADALLGDVVGIEIAGLRGSTWSLWGPEEGTARSALERRVAGELDGMLPPGPDPSVDLALAEIERELEGGTT